MGLNLAQTSFQLPAIPVSRGQPDTDISTLQNANPIIQKRRNNKAHMPQDAHYRRHHYQRLHEPSPDQYHTGSYREVAVADASGTYT